MDLFESFIKRLIFTPESVGLHGEKMIVRKLGWVQFCGKRGKILQNIYVPRENGETSEIDVLYITQKGIFVIESKNYSGYIFGSENNHNWTSTLYAGKDQLGRKKVEHHQFYNPVKQNNTHIKTLMHYLNVDIPMLSLIVFSERCELKKHHAFLSRCVCLQ
ncbi:nuclease-related domain-containing protein [Ruthenibacterium lactatiformans]|uniref:nuclease-related domain-containing protein n=1 Tax=Ruthenibacterium lactatiformans TaxID=1550024 RepID=UPI00351FAADC